MIGFGAGDKGGLQTGDGCIQGRQGSQHPQAKIRGDLVVAAAPSMQLTSQWADQLSQAAFGGGMDILVRFGKGEDSAFEFRADSLKPGNDAFGFVFGQDSGLSNGSSP